MRQKNPKFTKELRKDLRNNITSAESLLWRSLKDRQLAGRKFRRQYGIGPYVIDFFCPQENFGIELDGVVHSQTGAFEADRYRERVINKIGIKILRIENDYVFNNIEFVLNEIKKEFRIKE